MTQTICPICTCAFNTDDVVVEYKTWNGETGAEPKFGHLDCVLYLSEQEDRDHPPRVNEQIATDADLNRLAGLSAIVNRLLLSAIQRLPVDAPKQYDEAVSAYNALGQGMAKGDLGEIDAAWLKLNSLIGDRL